jgi:hypothetical protein
MSAGHEYSSCSIACINSSPEQVDRVLTVCAQAIIDDCVEFALLITRRAIVMQSKLVFDRPVGCFQCINSHCNLTFPLN